MNTEVKVGTNTNTCTSRCLQPPTLCRVAPRLLEKKGHALVYIVAPPKHAYIFYCVHLCSHGNTYVQVSQWADEHRIPHTVIACGDAQDADKWLEYTLDRCRHFAITLRERHQGVQESEREAWLRPAGQVSKSEDVKGDVGSAMESQTRFERPPRTSSRTSWCRDMREGSCGKVGAAPLNHSIKVVKFTEHQHQDLNDTTNRRMDSTTQHKGRQRKDSGFDATQHPGSGPDRAAMIPVVAGELPRSHDGGARTPIVITFGPKQDLDWLQFSYLVQNNQLGLDEIGGLVTRSASKDLPLEAGGETSVITKERSREGELRMPASRPKSAERASKWDGFPLGEHTPGPEHTLRPISEADDDRSFVRNSNATVAAPSLADSSTTALGGEVRLFRSSIPWTSSEAAVSRSCFSSDSSLASVNWPCKLAGLVEKPKSQTRFRWMQPWKREAQHHVTAEKSPRCPPRSATLSLLSKMSCFSTSSKPKKTIKKDSIKDKTERKLRKRLSLRADPSSDRKPEEAGKKRDPPRRPARPCTSQGLGVMRHPCKPNGVGKSTNEAKVNSAPASGLSSARSPPPSPSRSLPRHIQTAARGGGVSRPYRPSPLKNVTRVMSMDINKGLPPLPAQTPRRARSPTM